MPCFGKFTAAACSSSSPLFWMLYIYSHAGYGNPSSRLNNFKEMKLLISCITQTESINNLVYVRFQVLTAASMKFRFVFWDVLPCKITVDRRFRGTCCLHHQFNLVTVAWTFLYSRNKKWITAFWTLFICGLFNDAVRLHACIPAGPKL
jgi:hypothetical protein